MSETPAEPTPEKSGETPTPADVAPRAEGWKPPASQDEFDRIVERRLAQERKKYADYDTLRSKVEEAEQAKLTAEERAAKQAAKDAEKSVTERFTRRLAQSEVKATAARLGFHDPADALSSFGDLTEVIAGEDVDSKAVEARLSELAKSKPYLVKQDDPAPRRNRRPAGQTPSENNNSQEKPKRAADALRSFARGR